MKERDNKEDNNKKDEEVTAINCFQSDKIKSCKCLTYKYRQSFTKKERKTNIHDLLVSSLVLSKLNEIKSRCFI